MKRLVGIAVIFALVLGGTAGTAGAVNRGKIRRPGPIRVLLVGDSLTHFYQDRVPPLLGAGYEVISVGVPGSSLLDANLCDGSRSQALVNQYDPDVVVAEYTGNYRILEKIGGPAPCFVTPYGSAKFYSRWGASARKNQRVLKSRGAQLIWTLLPASTTWTWAGNYRVAIPKLNAIYRKAAPKGTFVDLWTEFGGATFNAAMHDADGLHLSPAGYDRFAAMVAAAAHR